MLAKLSRNPATMAPRGSHNAVPPSSNSPRVAPIPVSSASEFAPSPPKTAADEAKAWPSGMAMPLPPSVAWTMMRDGTARGGQLQPRPYQFFPQAGAFIFKEVSGQPQRENAPDRWHNSGGARGARDMKINETELIRRYYGSIVHGGQIMWRYHEYCRVQVSSTGRVDTAGQPCVQLQEDRSSMLYHVMPRRNGKGRPSKSEVQTQMELWAELTAKTAAEGPPMEVAVAARSAAAETAAAGASTTMSSAAIGDGSHSDTAVVESAQKRKAPAAGGKQLRKGAAALPAGRACSGGWQWPPSLVATKRKRSTTAENIASPFIIALQKHMTDQAIDQAELARRLGSSAQSVGQWMAGKSIARKQDTILAKLHGWQQFGPQSADSALATKRLKRMSRKARVVEAPREPAHRPSTTRACA